MLSDDQIKYILDAEIEQAIGYVSGELAAEREDALEYYRGEPVGDLSPPDIEGRSSVVSTDVADAIEWILPSVLKTFTQSDDAVRFDPENEEDEEQAEQESDYVSYVFNKENPGFLIRYTWYKDALLLKNGIVKTFWDKSEKETTEQYTGLDEGQYLQLVNDEEVTPTEHTEIPTEVIDELGDPVVLHDLKLKRKTTKGKGTVVPVPPEELLVNSDHNSILLKDARFVAHETVKTASELIQMGISKKVVDNLPAHDYDPEDDERNSVIDEQQWDSSTDQSQKKIRLFECYPLMDIEENGIAMRHKILYVQGADILEKEEADCVPFPTLTPIIMPHRYVGMSIYDRLKEIQKLKTIIIRQNVDNLVLMNNQRTYVNTSTRAGLRLSDVLTSRPGGIVRGKVPYQEAMSPIVTPPVGQAGFQMLEYLDKVRTERSGVGPDTMGQNINLSNDTAHGLERLMTAKEELVGLITRIFGETGEKEMFLQLRALLAKHQDKEKIVKLRGKWVPVNPSEWRERTSMTIKVGLGTGDRMKQQMALKEIMAIQEKIVVSGMDMVQPKHLYNSVEDFGRASGLNSIDGYFLDPESEEAKEMIANKPPPPPDINQQMLQLQAQIEQGKMENDRQRIALDTQKFQADEGRKQTELQQKAAVDQGKHHIALEDDKRKDSEAQVEAISKAHSEKVKEAELQLKEREIALKEREMEFKQIQMKEAETQNSEVVGNVSDMSEMFLQAEIARNERFNTVVDWISSNGTPRMKNLANQLTGE